MPKCTGYKRDGTPCKATVELPDTLCWWHDPANAQQRSRAASKAASSKGPGSEILEIKARIRELAEAVIEGKIDRGKASVAFQGLGVLKGFIELERKIYETEQLVPRLEELENLLAERKGMPQWEV